MSIAKLESIALDSRYQHLKENKGELFEYVLHRNSGLSGVPSDTRNKYLHQNLVLFHQIIVLDCEGVDAIFSVVSSFL